MNGGAYGGETKDVLVEARAVDRKGNTHVLRQCRHAVQLPPLRRARGPDLHRGPAAGRGRAIGGRDRPRHGRDHREPRGDPAGQEPHRRLDLQESARHKSWQLIDKAGLRGFAIGPAKVSRAPLQLPDQRGRRHRRADRRARRDGAPRGCARRPASSSNGRSSASALPGRGGLKRGEPRSRTDQCRRADGRLVGRARGEPRSAAEACAEALEAGRLPGHPESTSSATSPSVLARSQARCRVQCAARQMGRGRDASRAFSKPCEIPYTHSGVLASALAMHKEKSKSIFRERRHAGRRTACSSTLETAATSHPMALPYVVKPVAEGSSVGVHIVPCGANGPATIAPRGARTSMATRSWPSGSFPARS